MVGVAFRPPGASPCQPDDDRASIAAVLPDQRLSNSCAASPAPYRGTALRCFPRPGARMHHAPPVSRYRRGVNYRSSRSSGARGGVPCRIDSGTEYPRRLAAITGARPRERPASARRRLARSADAHRRTVAGPPDARVVSIERKRHVVLRKPSLHLATRLPQTTNRATDSGPRGMLGRAIAHAA